MSYSQLLLALVVVCLSAEGLPRTFKGLKSVEELAAEAGYSSQNYEVITEDGYSLWIHRLGTNDGPPVMIHHGLLLAADSWITRGPSKDLAFLLLKEGYDVWLSNQRGTVYNEYSLKYNRTNPKFWDFSFHEAGFYDLPAIIDKILKTREAKRIFFIGHSLATTTFLVMASSRPKYNSKIRLAVLMSPVAYSPSSEEKSGGLRVVTSSAGLIAWVLSNAGKYEILERTENRIKTMRDSCTFTVPMLTICLGFMGLAYGEHRANLDSEDWNKFIPYFFSGTSLKTLQHAAQLFTSDGFRQFDYGKSKNIKVYGSPQPPIYPLERSTAPIALIWSDNDPLLSRSSIERLANVLPNVVSNLEYPDPKFAHLDFLIGKDNNKVLYPKVIDLLKSFKRKT